MSAPQRLGQDSMASQTSGRPGGLGAWPSSRRSAPTSCWAIRSTYGYAPG